MFECASAFFVWERFRSCLAAVLCFPANEIEIDKRLPAGVARIEISAILLLFGKNQV